MAQTRITFRQLRQLYGYSVHFAMLKANRICNIYGPDSGCLIGWDDRRSIIRKRKLRAEVHIIKRNRRDNFFAKLEHSILSNGFINPIMVYSGKAEGFKPSTLPIEMQDNPRNILVCTHGGSRLYYAQKYKMIVPCIVCDWGAKFKKSQIINSEAEFLNMYSTPPKYIITPSGLRILNLTHVHMP